MQQGEYAPSRQRLERVEERGSLESTGDRDGRLEGRVGQGEFGEGLGRVGVDEVGLELNVQIPRLDRGITGDGQAIEADPYFGALRDDLIVRLIDVVNLGADRRGVVGVERGREVCEHLKHIDAVGVRGPLGDWIG